MDFIFNVEFKDEKRGSAHAKVTVGIPQGILAQLFWADENGKPLDDYLPIKAFALDENGCGTYEIADGVFLPEDAAVVLLKVFNDDMIEIVLPEMKFPIPESKRFPKAERIGRVFVTSDIHVGGHYFHNDENREKAFAFIAVAKPDFVLMAGDVTDNSNVVEWEEARALLEKHFVDIPLGIVPGNHDYAPYKPGCVPHYDEMRAFFSWVCEHDKALGAEVSPLSDRNEYTVRFAGVQAIMANPCHEQNVFFMGEDKLAWLDEQLAASDGERLRYVVTHFHQRGTVACFMRREDANYFRDNDAMQEILDRHGNIIHVSGHTHLNFDLDCLNGKYDGKHKVLYLNAGCAVWNGVCMEVRREYYLQHRATGQCLDICDGCVIARGVDFVSGKFVPRCQTLAEI